jgi:tryptophan-rich sensory protein
MSSDHHVLQAVLILSPMLLGMCSAALVSPNKRNPEIQRWYEQLPRPWFAPPKWAFPVVWTALYLAMGLASALVAGHRDSTLAMGLYGAQLAVNMSWSFVFFGLRRVRVALAVLCTLLVLVVLTMLSFRAFDVLAAWLLAPYVAWLCLAGLLNLHIARHYNSSNTNQD